MKWNDAPFFKKIFIGISSLFKQKPALSLLNNIPLLRAELFNDQQMEQQGENLAHLHKLDPKSGRDRLLPRLNENKIVLGETYVLMASNVEAGYQIAPAAEWLLDNIYFIEEQVHTAKKHLPKGYSQGLPRLAKGSLAGFPRVYDLALKIISHSDARLNSENLSSFVSAYQKIAPLNLGELWAIPIMLRLALIENLRRVAEHLSVMSSYKSLALLWAKKMRETAKTDPASLILVLADMARSDLPTDGFFIVELARRLQGEGPALTLPLTWIEQRLTHSGLNLNQIINSDIQQQAADQVSISNSVNSLRFLSAMNWREFVETMSIVDRILCTEPARVYSQMDFSTRDQYRHCIEKLSKHSNFSESQIAQQVVELAKSSIQNPTTDSRTHHIGFYLIDDGLVELEQAIARHVSLLEKVQKKIFLNPLRVYLGAILFLTSLVSLPLIYKAYNSNVKDSLLAAVIILSIIGSSHLSIALINWLVALMTQPKRLARLDFSKGIPSDARTLLVVPSLFLKLEDVDDLVKGLEVKFLANRVHNLHFCLLTDFADASTATLPGDDAIIQHAQKGIETLNQKYAEGENSIFFLFHRPRRWNPQEKKWMGYERKRGKLGELNAFLRSGNMQAFSVVVGNIESLSNTKYVITLDTDTQLPRETAWQLVGTLAHPLNQARFDKDKRRVTQGYGILQPRVELSLPGNTSSLYAELLSDQTGIDPYTRAVSDVYQDLFKEGSFIGKGIYDVDIFEQALKDSIPENKILSHDLLEGCYARCGLLNDVHLYEEHPIRYSAETSRRHRWMRGDWQLINWLWPRVLFSNGHTQKNPLSVLSLWKIFDNLRRSVLSPALFILLVLGWTMLPLTKFWTSVVISFLLVPPLITLSVDLLRKPSEVFIKQHLITFFYSTIRQFFQIIFTISCLPYEAYKNLDAILRSLWRIAISHKKLLEWNPSSQTNYQVPTKLKSVYRAMAIAPISAMAIAYFLFKFRISTLFNSLPFLVLWLFSPMLTWWISRPIAYDKVILSSNQEFFLGQLARKIWAFFETYVGPEDHWLPPDNIQEYPHLQIAHRTSPTNIGMALLANLTAYDFGYIQARHCIERTQCTLNTMTTLERYQGHFYNWYDTLTLQPLPPLYISSVDSGNLAGHLLTLQPGLLNIIDQPILGTRLFKGLRDTLNILGNGIKKPYPESFITFEKNVNSACKHPPTTLWETKIVLSQLDHWSLTLCSDPMINTRSEISEWAKALYAQCQEALNELGLLMPWINLPAPVEWFNKLPKLNTLPSLRELSEFNAQLLPSIEHYYHLAPSPDEINWLHETLIFIQQAQQNANQLIKDIEQLAVQIGDMAQMDYRFLYDKDKHLLTIGYNVSERRADSSFYDLLASEARLCSFVAISQNQLPQEHWFALGRQLVHTSAGPTLISWSGSMFEYLMPLLVMPTQRKTLLECSYHAAVKRQIEYGKQQQVPWGISESGFNTFDTTLLYQYRAFGVPGLGLKRGLAEDLVIAPYASMLALMIAPNEACQNLQRLSHEGFEGKFGLYEAIDFTATRLPPDETYSIIRSFMAHHQGMGFLSLAYVLCDQPMQKRFKSNPAFEASLLLLHEKAPNIGVTYKKSAERLMVRTAKVGGSEMPIRTIDAVETALPEVQLLSNGKYHVMITHAGAGYSHWKNLAITRWREDTTCDKWGMFCYLRDMESGAFWSTTHQPTLKAADHYQAIFSEDRVEFCRSDDDFETHTEIVVSPEDDIELRRHRITNRAYSRRSIEVTSYAEVVLAPALADAMHPAFSNLFVQTEIVHSKHAIICTRRPRSLHEASAWMFHLMVCHGSAKIEQISYETDRMEFIGRGRSLVSPQAMLDRRPLSGKQGTVLDPIVAIRYKIALEPDQSVTLDLITGAAESREQCIGWIDKYQDRHLANRVFKLSWSHSQVILRQLNATEAETRWYGALANSIVYLNSALRAEASILLKNRRGQAGLWSYAISGDFPIVLLQIKSPTHISLVRQMVQAHSYWRRKGLVVDLIISNVNPDVYRQSLQEQIIGIVASSGEGNVFDRPGGIFVRSIDQISGEDWILLQAVARIIISDSHGTLLEQMNRIDLAEVSIPKLIPTQHPRKARIEQLVSAPTDLILTNGIGGFTPEGREYVITTSMDQQTPLPWVNILANTNFGSVMSENGQSYTWTENAHEFRLTPWTNDSVSNTCGEAFYLRDEVSGQYWSPTPYPSRSSSPYVTRHGFGYSVFEHAENGIHSELWVYVAQVAAVKFFVWKIRNQSGRARQLSATGYIEWVLGDLREKTAMHVVTELDSDTGALFALNAYHSEFMDRIAFFDVGPEHCTVTASRKEFIGRNRTLHDPAVMERIHLSGKVGAGLDPCAAIQVPFKLNHGEEREIIFKLGIAHGNIDACRRLVRQFRDPMAAHQELIAVQAYWKKTLETVQIQTPEPMLNVLANGWLMYQTLACRFWARSGHYQSGGAFGFRDQLQDTMALVYVNPQLMRDHLLLCAAHQFVEGDVQHWWHPPNDKGVRTKCSDDYLWLPLATHHYVTITGDKSVLDEPVHFLEGRPVNSDEESYYDQPAYSTEKASLYQHCVRAIIRGFRYGVHGLPLMGSCDWNDGMDQVGKDGKGESVWLGFFFYEVLTRFNDIAQLYNDGLFAKQCQDQAKELQKNLEENGWDGQWYRRAYFDDGTPLGSAINPECQIDAISQSWAVLSQAADPQRASMAMQALDKHLVRRQHKLIQLLDPPFDQSDLNPGYIKGYGPGIRENGGQYTHAAIWAVMAFAKLGDRARTWELLQMINPICHSQSAQDRAIYKVEPYVMAADIYAIPPHTGRGGWTWYTGSASWMYRLILESLLGLRIKANQLSFTPCLPPGWDSFKLDYRYQQTLYQIVVSQKKTSTFEVAACMVVDDIELTAHQLTLINDLKTHFVKIFVD